MEPSSQLLLELVQALGPMGFVMWLVHRTTTNTIPRLAKSFEDGIDRQRVDFRQIMTDQRQDFERVMSREQDKTDKMLDTLSKLNESIRDAQRGDNK